MKKNIYASKVSKNKNLTHTHTGTIATFRLVFYLSIIFFFMVLTTSLKAQVCNFPCNGKLTASPWSTGLSQNNPFGNDTVSCWTAAGHHPKLSDTAWSAPTSARLWSTDTKYGTSIKTITKYNFIKGKKYIVSMMVRKFGTINMDSVVLAITPNLITSLNTTHPTPSYKQTLLNVSNVSDTTWHQYTACITADSTAAMDIWLCAYDGLATTPGYTGPKAEVLIDDIEIIPTFGFAGSDKVVCDGVDVTIGFTCTFLNFPTIDYDWINISVIGEEGGDPINSATLNTHIPGTYLHTRTIKDIYGNTIPCGTDTDTVVVTTGVTPSFTLGPDTIICQSDVIWLAPRNLTPTGRIYLYHWSPTGSNDSIQSGMKITHTLTITDSISGCSKTVSRKIYRDPDILPWKHKKLYCKSSLPLIICTKLGYTDYWVSINHGTFTGPTTSPCANLDSTMLISNHIYVVFKVASDSIPGCFGYDTFDLEFTTAKFYLPNDTAICGTSYKVNINSAIDSVLWYNANNPSTVIHEGNSYTVTTTGYYIVKGYDPVGCLLANDTIHIQLNAVPHIILSKFPLSTVCQTGLIDIDSIAKPYGGIWSGSGITNISGHYFFNIDSAICGNNFIHYVYIDSAGCKDSATAIVPKYCGKHIDSIAPQCTTNDSILLTGTPPFGAFYGAGVTYASGIGYYFHPEFFDTAQTNLLTKVYFNYTDSAGCQGTDSIEVQINIGPKISILNTNGDFMCGDTITPDLHCLKDGLTLTLDIDTAITPIYDVKWSDGTTGNSNIIVYTKGIYWVKVTLPSGCYSIDTLIIDQDPCECCIADSLLQTFQKEYFRDGFNIYPTATRYTPSDSGYITLSGMSDHSKAADDFSHSEYLLLTKYDRSGNILWNNQFKFDYNVFPSDIEIDGEYYVILGNKLFMHDDTLHDLRYDDSTDYQVMLMRTDNNGNFIDVNYYGGRFEDHGHDLLVTESEYVVVGSGWRIYNNLNYNPISMNLKYLPGYVWNGEINCDLFHPSTQNLYYLNIEKSGMSVSAEKLYSIPQDTCPTSVNPFATIVHAIKTNSSENAVRVVPSLNRKNYTILGNAKYSISNCDSNATSKSFTSDIIMLEVDNIGSVQNKRQFGFQGEAGALQGHTDIANDLIVTENEYYILGGTNTDLFAGNTPAKEDTVYYTMLGKVDVNLKYIWKKSGQPAARLYGMTDSLFTTGLNLIESNGSLFIYGSTFRKKEASVPYLMELNDSGYSAGSGDSLHIFYHGNHAGPSMQGIKPESFIGNGLVASESGTVTLSGTHDRNFFGHLGGFQVKTPNTGEISCGGKYAFTNQKIANQIDIRIDELDPCDAIYDTFTPIQSSFKPSVTCCSSGNFDSVFHQGASWYQSFTTKSNYTKTTLSVKNQKSYTANSYIEAFPNPTNGQLFVKFVNIDLNLSKIKLMSSDGRLIDINQKIISQEGNTNTTLFDLSNYPSGIYFLEVITENKTYTKLISIIK